MQVTPACATRRQRLLRRGLGAGFLELPTAEDVSKPHSSPRSPRHWRGASRDTQGRRWLAGNPGMRLTKKELFLALE